jgi:hypothetical protein
MVRPDFDGLREMVDHVGAGRDVDAVKLASYLLFSVPEKAGPGAFEAVPVTREQLEELTDVELDVFDDCREVRSALVKQDSARSRN